MLSACRPNSTKVPRTAVMVVQASCRRWSLSMRGECLHHVPQPLLLTTRRFSRYLSFITAWLNNVHLPVRPRCPLTCVRLTDEVICSASCYWTCYNRQSEGYFMLLISIDSKLSQRCLPFPTVWRASAVCCSSQWFYVLSLSRFCCSPRQEIQSDSVITTSI